MNKFDLNIGDKVYCHTDRYYSNVLINEKGKTYEIKHIKKDLNNFFKDISLFIIVENEHEILLIDGYWIFNSDNKIKNCKLFYDYFMTLNQYRNLKLKKINGKN